MSDYRKYIAGFDQVKSELEICRKYGIDYRMDKGKKKQILDRLHPDQLELRVSAKTQETASSTTLRLVAENGYLPPFQAGQYINVFVDIDGVRTSRPYSISSSPRQTAYYDITVKRVENGFVSDYLLDRLQAGGRLETGSPAGHFCYNPIIHGKELVFLAGGSGITPFMSMIREATDAGLDRKIHLIYGIQSPNDVIFGKELAERAEIHKNFSYSLVASNPPEDYQGIRGFIDSRLIQNLVADIERQTFYVCGPAAMYEMCIPELEKLNLPRKRIRREVFGAKTDITQEGGWPADITPDREFTVKVGDKSIKAQAGESLMTAFERHGIVVKACCRSGECSLCRVKLVSGQVFQPNNVLVRKSDRDHGYIHSCQSYPLADLEVLV